MVPVAGKGSEVVRAEDVTLAYVLPVWESAGRRFIERLRDLPASLCDASVPGLKWTVAETAAHMLSIVRRGLDDFRRSDTLEGLADLNDTCIAEIEERDLGELASLIEDAHNKLTRALRNTSEEDAAAAEFPLHAGVRANLPTALSYGMFDFLGHGYDISLAAGRTWSIQPAEAGVTLRAALPAMRPWIRQEILVGQARVMAFRFPSDAALEIQTGKGLWRVRSIFNDRSSSEVDPSALLLAIAGRENPSDPNVTQIAGWFRPI